MGEWLVSTPSGDKQVSAFRMVVHLLVWDYTTLDNLTAKNPRMLAALRDGFIRSAAFKHGLLRERTHDAPVYAGINTPS